MRTIIRVLGQPSEQDQSFVTQEDAIVYLENFKNMKKTKTDAKIDRMFAKADP